jgi:hypothetical protein
VTYKDSQKFLIVLKTRLEVDTMLRKRALLVVLGAGLILGSILNQPAIAMGGYTGDQIAKGLIQNIDYQRHSITVNGQTYAVSPSATFSGVAGFSVLSIGMPIQYMLGDNANSQMPGPVPNSNAAPANVSQPQVIVAITWLPGGVK